ncbi:MAG: hypothetical protein KAU38_03750 [Desulfobacterales bacterium]|nr:hypothetical protein [Desulfobacterales bacterium]
MIRKLASILVIALFVISFAGVAVSQEAQETMVLKGTIISINADTGKVGVQDESGNIMTLTAGSDTDLKTLSGGDRVSVEYSSDGVIKSITKQE